MGGPGQRSDAPAAVGFPPATPPPSLLQLPTPPPPPFHSGDCAAEATKISRGSCSAFRPLLGVAAAYGTANDCGTLTAALDKYVATDLSDACCRDARAFVTSGCACAPEVADLLTGLRVLPAGTDAAMALSGIVNLLQASKCASTAGGGPILNSCTGSAGCAAAA